ncbi:MAG: phospholipid carrier-dependent glycosyltransferase [Actinomycetota bacterium]
MTVTVDAPAGEPDVTDRSADNATERAAMAEPPQPAGPVPESLRPWHDPHPRLGWLVSVLTVLVAAFTRLWALGWPPGKSFDEVYYANESQELLRFGYEDNRGYMFIVHPPLGKWLIALPQWLLRNQGEFAWRLAPALAGIVSVLLVTRIARRMFRSNLFGGTAGLLLALDGVSVVQSRVALLDIFLQLFVLAGFGALILDRDQLRGRLAGLLADGADLGSRVPTLGPRPWRLVGGVMLSASCAVKWSALSFFVALVVLSLVWDRGALKAAGVQRSWRTAALRSWLGAIGSLLVAPVAVYLLSWLGWFAGENSWGRHWADAHGSSATMNLPLGIHLPFNWGFLPAGLRSLGAYHLDAYRFHESLSSPHAYGSKPWSWLILGRPVEYYYAGDGVTGCGATTCSREILLIGTPLMWWAFVPALLWLVWHWLTTRDWRAAAVWVAFAAGWLVWLQNTKRTMFLFYMTPLMPFLVLGLTLALGSLVGPGLPRVGDTLDDGAAERRRLWGSLAVAGYLGLVIVDFAWMWPLFTGGLLTYEQWHLHMWFPSWV